MSIYLDHTATTPPNPESVQVLTDCLKDVYGNPASQHEAGRIAERTLTQARKQIAVSLGCRTDELILTSCGSESINMAVKGVLWHRSPSRRRIIISEGEHDATWEAAAWMERQGSQVERLPLTKEGIVSLDALERALKKPAALISLIHVNNETGACNPVDQIVAIRNQKQPEALLHFDTVQTWGKTPFLFQPSGVDMLSGSGHKVGAPKGIGWLVRNRRSTIEPLIHGGGQQNRLRSGTENPPLAAALAVALENAVEHTTHNTAHTNRLRTVFLDELALLNVPHILQSPDESLPQIMSISFPGLQGETLVHALSAESIYVSTGSACGAKKKHGNRVLQAMGIDREQILCSVRISLSENNTENEIIQTAQAIARLYGRLARTNR